jgi:hypothetical protein
MRTSARKEAIFIASLYASGVETVSERERLRKGGGGLRVRA